MGVLSRTAVILLLVVGSAGIPASAWQPETRMAMADEAVRLMPASLRMALQTHRDALMRGLLEPMVEEDGAEHRPTWTGGRLEHAVQQEADALIDSLGRKTPFAELARAFGRLAHFVMDAGFPPGVAETDAGDRFTHFARFCESRRAKFPLVFYGHSDTHLTRGDFLGFARARMVRSRADDAELVRAYAVAGTPPHPAAFDDRSVPFAIGSLSYSRTVTDVVRAWLAAWGAEEGDMGRTPYLKPSEP